MTTFKTPDGKLWFGVYSRQDQKRALRIVYALIWFGYV